MTRNLYTNLSWLPTPPESFGKLCKEVIETQGDASAKLRFLAGHSLDENHLNRLSKTLGRVRELHHSLQPLTPLRIGILGNATTSFLVPAIEATALRYGFDVECIEANFDQAMQEALSPDSKINRQQCDYVLIAIDYRGLQFCCTPGSANETLESVNEAIGKLFEIRDGIRAFGQSTCIFQTLPRDVKAEFGSFDLGLLGTQRNAIDSFNRKLAEAVHETDDAVLDVAAIAETVGLAEWHDETLWNMAKIPFANTFLPLYADHVCRLIASMRGRSRKCLVLDLDNTLWGGIVGDGRHGKAGRTVGAGPVSPVSDQ